MKAIIVYSGKGGVGKTTTAANIAKTLADQGKKVFIVDGDINTPSMGVIFKGKHPSDNIWLASTSFSGKNMIYLEKSLVRDFLRSAIREINEVDPDYVIIDTPPSITDVHINLIQTFKVSGILIVTQPSEISRLDVNRTAKFFTDKYKDAACVVIENMVQDESDTKYNWEVAARIKFEPTFDGEKVLKQNSEQYAKVIGLFDSMNVANVRLEALKRELFDESLTEDDIPSKDTKAGRSVNLRFINLSTWEAVKERIQYDDFAGMHLNDKHLELTTKENLGRMIKAFEFDPEAYFMVTKAPNTEIPLLAGEIGLASLFVADSYYGLPRLKYKTRKGDVVLFCHEVTPVNSKMIQDALDDGYSLNTDGRYIPSKALCEEVSNAFGDRVGMGENWEKKYEEITNPA